MRKCEIAEIGGSGTKYRNGSTPLVMAEGTIVNRSTKANRSTARSAADEAFEKKDVVGVILSFVPSGKGVVRLGLTSRGSCRAWTSLAETRLTDSLQGTGLSLEMVQRSRVLGGVPTTGLEAILNAVRDVIPRPPAATRNSFDGLALCLKLSVNGKTRALRVIEGQPRVRFERYGDSTFDGELKVIFTGFEPVPTTQSWPPDDYDGWDVSTAGQLFLDDVPEDANLSLKVSAYDKRTNSVAHVYAGSAVRRVLPHYHDNFHDCYAHTRFGFDFKEEVIEAPSVHSHWGSHMENHATASFYVDVQGYNVVPEDEEADYEDYLHWQVPIGTNFDTLELHFDNVDDIQHLITVLAWTPL